MMNLWPFRRRETRSGTYTDALVSTIIDQANGSQSVSEAATGALETAAGLVGRAFASATVEGPDQVAEALTPAVMNLIGRSLIRLGDLVFLIEVRRGRLMLYPVESWDVYGGHDPDGWLYRLNLAGPTTHTTMERVPAARILHLRYSVHPRRPWEGIGPIQAAALAGKLSASTVGALADESGSMLGFVLPTPEDGDSGTIEKLKSDLRNSRGKTHLVESMHSWNAEGRTNQPAGDWMRRRMGPEPPESLVRVQEVATRETLSACGVSPILFDSRAGAAGREAYRQLLHSCIQPLAALAVDEFREKLDPAISLRFDSLFAADLQGRARAWRSLVGNEASMSPEIAARLAGVSESDD